MIHLILGGARSGKSVVAETLAGRLAAPVTYLATAVVPAGDRDLAARVAAHRRRRPAEWSTVETGPDLVPAISAAHGSLLIESLGTWVAASGDFDVDGAALCAALADHGGDVVVVSEEVGLGVHPSTAIGGDFRDALGVVNQQVATVADDVWLVVAGRMIPLGRP